MLIHSASQLLTLAGGPQRGRDLGRLGLIEDGAVLVRGGRIEAVGPSAVLRAAYPHEETWDASGHVVMPGFVDPHTHLVWAGDRAQEFEWRTQGKTYQEIAAAGGGILATVRATRAASPEELLAQARQRARTMLRHGTTTAEAKTGYGLEPATELRLLEAILALNAEGPLELIPTYLAAHDVPPNSGTILRAMWIRFAPKCCPRCGRGGRPMCRGALCRLWMSSASALRLTWRSHARF